MNGLNGLVNSHLIRWNARETRRNIYNAGRQLMLRVGGFEALCLAEPDQIQAWVNTKMSSASTAYQNWLNATHVYGALIEEGYIGATGR